MTAEAYQATGAGANCAGDLSLSAGDDNGSNHVVVEAYPCHGSNVGPMGTFRSGNAGTTGGVPFIATETTAFNIIGMAQEGKNHAYETEISGCLQHKGLSASGNEAGTVVAFHATQDPISGAVSPAMSAGNKQGCGTIGVAVGFNHKRGQSSDLGTTEDGTPPLAEGGGQGLMQGMMVRRLTPLECTRLQGFPDDWLDGLGLSDAVKYRTLGNAVCVPVAAWIARRILLHAGVTE